MARSSLCCTYNILIAKPYGKRLHETPRRRWEKNIRKQGVRMWTGFNRLRIRSVENSCEQGKETWGFIKDGEFLNQLRDYAFQ
jgi:hypothetical protein